MGVKNPQFSDPGQPQVVAQISMKDHKLDDSSEQEQIRSLGKKSNKGHHNDLIMMSHINALCICTTTCAFCTMYVLHLYYFVLCTCVLL